MIRNYLLSKTLVASLFFSGCITFNSPPVEDSSKKVQSEWLFWRGPNGEGVSKQTGLPQDLNDSLLWTHDIQGGGVPVVAGSTGMF